MPSSNVKGPKQPVDLAYAFGLSPKDAVAYFESKGHKMTFNWQEMLHQAHAKAFTVAKVDTMEVLNTIREEVADALKHGMTEHQFIKQLKPKLQKLGWWGRKEIKHDNGEVEEIQLGSPRRLRTIYRTNLQTAFQSGRYKQQLENADLRPYWMYVAVMDGNTRPSHAALNGKVFRYDDPIWQYLYPPNGWGCRCRVRTLSERKLKRLGLEVSSSEGYLQQLEIEAGTDKRTGEIYQLPVTQYSNGNQTMTPDAGWSYNPGQAAFGTDIAMARRISQVQDASLRAQTIQALNNSELRQELWQNWVAETYPKIQRFQVAKETTDKVAMQANSYSKKEMQVLAIMPEPLRAEISAIGQPNFGAGVMMVNANKLAHAISKKHGDSGRLASQAQIQALAAQVANQSYRAYWDTEKSDLVLFFDEGEHLLQVVVTPPPSSYHNQLDVVVNVQLLDKQVERLGKYRRLRD